MQILHLSGRRTRFFPWNEPQRMLSGFYLCTAFFFAGLLAGSLIGTYAAAPPRWLGFLVLTPQNQADTFLPFRFLLPVILVSTSYLGLLFLPSLCALRGVCLGYAPAVCFSAGRFRGLLCALFSVGIPAVIGLPAFFYAIETGMRCSALLLPRFRAAGDGLRAGQIVRRFLLIFFLAFAEFGYCRWLFPLLSAVNS